MLIVICVKRPSEEGDPLGWGDRFEKFVETEGILTLPKFLSSNGSLI